MAYKLYYGSGALFDPTTDNVVYDAKLTAKTNTSDYLDFTVPYGHDLYSALAVKAETVKLYWDKDCLYVGTIESIDTDLEGNLSITCTGALDWLADTVVRPYSTIEGEQPLTAPTSVNALFDWYVKQHNEHCMDSRKQFAVGVNQGALLDENNYVYRESEQLPTTLDEIQDKIIDELGGYLFVRYEPLTIDLYADVHTTNAQIIDFGVNITDFSSTTDAADQYTAIRPEGATPDKEDDQEDDPDPITIETLPDGGTGYNADLWKTGDVVYSISGVSRYGYREYAYSNDDCETPEGLLTSACKVLTVLLSPQLSITVKAVDLALFMDDYTHLKVGEAVRVRSKFHGVDEYLMVQSIELDLQDPSQSTYELGAEYSTLTGQQSSYLKSLNSGINSALDATSALSSETKAAAKDAQDAKNAATDASTTANEAKEAANKAAMDIQTEYAQSGSATVEPTSGWSTDAPEWTEGTYIWMRHTVTYGNGNTETTPGVVITGNTGKQGAQGIQGIQGPQGEQGIQGEKGEDGSTTYFHIKYAPVESPTASQMTETPDVYIGTYVDTTQEDSADPASYTWARFQGLQGEKGDQGIPGTGVDGKTSYLHIKYSDDGTTFTGNDGEDPGNYIGQYTDFTQADSTTFSDYTWTLIKGETGTDGTRGKSVLNVSTYPVCDAIVDEYKDDPESINSNVYIWNQEDLKTDTGLSEILVGDVVQVGSHQYTISELDDEYSPSPRSVSLADEDSDTSLTSDTTTGTAVAKATGRSVTRPAILTLTTEPTSFTEDGVTWYAWLLSALVNEAGVYDGGLGDIIQVGDYQYVVEWVSGKRELYDESYTQYSVLSKTRTKITGDPGAKGEDGNGIASSEVTYQTSTSGTVTPTGIWTTDVPDVTRGQYLWTKTVTTYTNGSTTTSYSVAYQAEDGAKGDDGVSPTVDTSKSGTTTTITITDADGTKTATIEDGTDGKGVKSTAIAYKTSTSGTTVPSGTWSTTIPSVTQGQYLWTRTITTYTDASTSTGYSVSYQPIDGTSVSVNTTAITYQASTSGTTVPSGTWSTTIPSVTQGQYLWTKTVVTYSDGKSTTSYSVSYKGTDGDSVTIKSTVVTYQTSTSGTSVPSGTWSTTIPSVTQGQYLWTRTVVTYSPSGSTTSYSVAYQAKDGEAGDDGKMLYGTCSTAGATVAKVATVTDFTLTAGTTVSIKFTYANSAAAPTLNINSLGAKKILTNGTTYAYWAAGASVVFVYDGTQFQVCSSPVYANTVTVGNPAGQNVYIDSDSVDIRNGTTVNSSFSGNMVELGKSSLNSTIKMCDGAAVVTATEKYITLSNQLNARLLGGADITGSTSSWGLVEALSDGYNVGAVSLTSGAKNDDGGYFTAKLLLNSNNIIGKEFSQITLAADHVAIEAEGYSDLLTDWVVTEGTSGIWTYRKWASGKTECWGTKTYTNLYLDGTYGSFAYADVAFDSFPFAFPNTPKVFINLNQASGLPYCFSYGLSTTGFNVNIANWQRITATFSVAAYVLGYI